MSQSAILSCLVLLVSASTFSCAAAGVDLEGVEVIRTDGVVEPIDAPCEMTFEPAGHLLDATQAAAERWSAATDCYIHVQVGGIAVQQNPVEDMLAVRMPDGTFKHAPTEAPRCEAGMDPSVECSIRMCGITNKTTGDIGVASCGQGFPFTILHEMGHALSLKMGHAASGIMAAGDGPVRPTDVINQDSLDFVCSTLDCGVQTPEVL